MPIPKHFFLLLFLPLPLGCLFIYLFEFGNHFFSFSNTEAGWWAFRDDCMSVCLSWLSWGLAMLNCFGFIIYIFFFFVCFQPFMALFRYYYVNSIREYKALCLLYSLSVSLKEKYVLLLFARYLL